MAINFPTSPSTNDTHTTSGGTTYLWDGTSWKAQGTTSQYTLPTASSTVLGGIKIGSRLTISSGVLEADVQGGTTVFTGLTDTPSSLTAGKWLKVNAGGTAIEETDPPSAQGLSPRGTASGTSASLAAGASGNLDINGVAKSYGILKITTSSAAWVTLYTSQTARTNDTSRAATTDPVPGSGVVAEVITSGDTTQIISPMLCGYNDESTPVTTVYAKVRNETISATTITVTLTFVPLEA
tara:strand:+ start:126 stop:842 length:717 start_codon:yes stop_codon:yes gene_type:complete